jgi:predicted Fe-Mo cluster-binding NifX family protein
MKIAVSTDSGTVSAHFGRCPSYTLVDIEDGRVVGRVEIPNPGHQPGFLPQFLAEKGVSVIIAGGMGPRAQGLFAERNIRTIIGVQGAIDDVVQKFLRQELEAGPDLCDHDHRQDGVCRNETAAGEPGAETPGEGPICVSAKGPDLDAEVDPRFGRAAYFLFVDPRTLSFRALLNPHAQDAHGAGVQSAQLVAAQGVGAVVTGQVGPNAARILQAAGIRVVNVDAMAVRDALSRLKG